MKHLKPKILNWWYLKKNILTEKKEINQLHAVSRTQQGRQRESSVKTHHFPLSTEFWRHCVFSGGTKRRALPRPERRNENITLSKYFISSNGDRNHNQSILQSYFLPLRYYLHTNLIIKKKPNLPTFNITYRFRNN